MLWYRLCRDSSQNSCTSTCVCKWMYNTPVLVWLNVCVHTLSAGAARAVASAGARSSPSPRPAPSGCGGTAPPSCSPPPLPRSADASGSGFAGSSGGPIKEEQLVWTHKTGLTKKTPLGAYEHKSICQGFTASCWIRTYAATSLWFLITVYCHVTAFYQVFLLSGYPVFLFHLVAQLIDLPLQFTDGVGQN